MEKSAITDVHREKGQALTSTRGAITPLLNGDNGLIRENTTTTGFLADNGSLQGEITDVYRKTRNHCFLSSDLRIRENTVSNRVVGQ